MGLPTVCLLAVSLLPLGLPVVCLDVNLGQNLLRVVLVDLQAMSQALVFYTY